MHQKCRNLKIIWSWRAVADITFFVFSRSYSTDLILSIEFRSICSFSNGIWAGLLLSSSNVFSNSWSRWMQGMIRSCGTKVVIACSTSGSLTLLDGGLLFWHLWSIVRKPHRNQKSLMTSDNICLVIPWSLSLLMSLRAFDWRQLGKPEKNSWSSKTWKY